MTTTTTTIMMMLMNTLLLEKLLAATILTASTVLGVWSPFCFLHGGRDGTAQPLHVLFTMMARALSMANCFSAGMLLAMALTHALSGAIANGHAVSPRTLCVGVLCGLLLPAVIERGVSERGTLGGHNHRHDLGHKYESSHGMSHSSLVVLLMCFHAVAEGVMLGLEESTASLVSSTVPLLIHRFLDGVVVGVSIAKELSVSSEACSEVVPLAPGNGGNHGSSGGLCTVLWQCLRRCLWRRSVLLWLVVTPATALLCELLKGRANAPGGREVVGSQQTYHHHGNDSTAVPTWLVMAEAVNSGFFLFAGLMILLQEDLKGLRASVSLLLGVAFTVLLDVLAHH